MWWRLWSRNGVEWARSLGRALLYARHGGGVAAGTDGVWLLNDAEGVGKGREENMS